MTDNPDLSKFPDLGFDISEKLDKLPPPEPLLPSGLEPPECTFCEKQAVYLLDEIHLEVKTSEGALHTIITKLNPKSVVAACMDHKDSERDQEIAEGAHLSVIHESSVQSTLEHYDVYWKMI